MRNLKNLLKAVAYSITLLTLVVAVFIFAGMFKKVFMSICFFLMFCCLVAVIYNINKPCKEDR